MHLLKILLLASAAATGLSAAVEADDATDLQAYREAEAIGLKRLETFDTLDFDVFTNQKWDRLHESHAADIKVYWPDGRVTEGLETHIGDLQYMFSFAPDTRIKEHPVKLQDGAWTSVIGIMEGTFTEAMKLADGTEIPPTGKAFKIRMSTVGHWGPDGTMTEEYLFWDNQSFMTQLGLGQ